MPLAMARAGELAPVIAAMTPAPSYGRHECRPRRERRVWR